MPEIYVPATSLRPRHACFQETVECLVAGAHYPQVGLMDIGTAEPGLVRSDRDSIEPQRPFLALLTASAMGRCSW